MCILPHTQKDTTQNPKSGWSPVALKYTSADSTTFGRILGPSRPLSSLSTLNASCTLVFARRFFPLKHTDVPCTVSRAHTLGQISPQNLQKDPTLQTPGLPASGLLNGERINLCCLKPVCLWWCLTTAPTSTSQGTRLLQDGGHDLSGSPGGGHVACSHLAGS